MASSLDPSENPAEIISSLFKTDFDSTFATYTPRQRKSPHDMSSSSSTTYQEYPRKRRKSVHEGFRQAVNEGKLQFKTMNNAESFVKWVMDGNKKVAIYCEVCEKFLGPNKGGSYFTHVRTCKSVIYPEELPPAPLNEQQKDDFTFAVVEAVGKDLTLFGQINSEAFKQCIQKALDIGFEAKTQGYSAPDASELLNNPQIESYMTSEFGVAQESASALQFKNELLFNEIPSESASPSLAMKEEYMNDRKPWTLGQDIFTANDYTDVTLTTKDGIEIKAHRCFLSIASPVFKQIFDKKTRNASKIDVDFPEAITRRALQFCYGDEAAVAPADPALLEFADHYNIQQLKERCLSHLEDTVDATNVCEIIQAAYENNYEALKQKCIRTLVDNKEIIGKGKVNSLPQPILCDILFAQ